MYYDMFVIAYLFFLNLNELLLPMSNINVLDVGSFDVNGNIRDVISLINVKNISYNYTGIDLTEGPNVDVVVSSEYSSWPFSEEEFDVVTSVSALEHDSFFWETFTKMVSLLKDGGLLYLNVPAMFPIHRYPVDNWRLLPDSAGVLVAWAAKHNQYVDLLHSSSIDYYTLMIFRKRKSPHHTDGTRTLNRQLHDHFVPMQRDSIMNIQLMNSFLRNTEVESEEALRLQYARNALYRYFPLPYQLLRDIPSKYTIDSKCRTPHKHQLARPSDHLDRPHYLVPVTISIPTDNITPNTCHFDAQFVLIESDLASEGNLEASIEAMLSSLHIEEAAYVTRLKDWILANKAHYSF